MKQRADDGSRTEVSGSHDGVSIGGVGMTRFTDHDGRSVSVKKADFSFNPVLGFLTPATSGKRFGGLY